jgi:hypothetical protein
VIHKESIDRPDIGKGVKKKNQQIKAEERR